MIIAKYKFNPSTYADLLPEFNSGFSYTKSDTTNSDGTITRTINSDSLPTYIRFGERVNVSDRSRSLLEILDMNTSSITDMSYMFRYCENLTSVICDWDTSQATNMTHMFANCSNLLQLDVSKWNLSKVKQIQYIFGMCTSLSSLNISNWDTSQVTNMEGVFNNCSNLTSLDVSNWDTSNVTTMVSLFRMCSSLTSLNINNWDTSKVTTTNNMFRNCTSLTSLNINNWDTSKVTDMQYLFGDCSSLIQLNINNWNTSKVTTTNNMFRNCTSLTSLNLMGWDNINLTDMSAMFYNCSSLISVNLNRFNTSKVTNMSYMFQNCSSLTSIVIDSWDTSQVTTMINMFAYCSSLTSLDLSNWNTSRLTNTTYMFNGCNKLTSLDLSNWNTCRLTSMNSMFSECPSLTSLDLSNWNTSKVVNMSYVFSKCTSLITLDLSNWHISESTNTSGLFVGSMSNFYKVNLKYADEYTVSKIVTEFPNRNYITPGYVLSSVDFTSNKNWQRIKSSHNRFYLPQPLNKIGDVKDRLYWDENKGHYCIEQMIYKAYISDYDWWELLSTTDGYDIFQLSNFNGDFPYRPTIASGRLIVSDDSVIDMYSVHLTMKYPSSRFGGDVEKFKEYCLLNDVYVLLQRYNAEKLIIDLPHLNQKLTFDSYNPSTSIDIPNRPLKASKAYLDAPIARYRYTNLQPNTQYNVQFDCKGDSGIKVNLGGTEVTFTPTSDWTRKNLTITTPSELVNDKLSISNVGITSNNVIDNVMLFSEVIAQEPDYIEGIQNIGELQEDGTYKIDILSNDGNKIFDADTWVNSTLGSGTVLNSGFYKVLGSNMIEIIANDVRTPDTVSQIQLKPNTKYSILCSDASLTVYIYFKLQNAGQISGRSKIDFTTDETGRIGFKIPNGVGKIVKIDIVDEKGFNYSAWSTQSILLPQPLNKIGELKDRFYWDYDKGHYCIEQNINDDLQVLETPNIIDLTEMNKKITFDTYLPNTCVDVTNLPLQPYKLQLEDDTVRYKSTIEPSTLYTIQFNCLAKSTTNLTLDLGGSRKTVDPIIGVNHVQITTPSVLASDRLFLIGTGIVVKEVIVNKGTMNQYTKYFDGEQSVGELQEDGSYIIRISTDNYTSLWEGDL